RALARPRADHRSLWLFACACCRLIPELASDDQASHALGEAESCASGLLPREDLQKHWPGPLPDGGSREARMALQWVVQPWLDGWTAWKAAMAAGTIMQTGTPAMVSTTSETGERLGRRAERRAAGRAKKARRLLLGHLLHDIFRPPSPLPR